MLSNEAEANTGAPSTTAAPSVESASSLHEKGPPAGMTRLHIFVSNFQGLVNEVKVFGTGAEAKAKFKEVTGVDYDTHAAWTGTDQSEPLEGWDSDLDGTDIDIQDVLIRECETPGCPDHYVGSEKQEAYFCEAHWETKAAVKPRDAPTEEDDTKFTEDQRDLATAGTSEQEVGPD